MVRAQGQGLPGAGGDGHHVRQTVRGIHPGVDLITTQTLPITTPADHCAIRPQREGVTTDAVWNADAAIAEVAAGSDGGHRTEICRYVELAGVVGSPGGHRAIGTKRHGKAGAGVDGDDVAETVRDARLLVAVEPPTDNRAVGPQGEAAVTAGASLAATATASSKPAGGLSNSSRSAEPAQLTTRPGITSGPGSPVSACATGASDPISRQAPRARPQPSAPKRGTAIFVVMWAPRGQWLELSKSDLDSAH